jgi:protein TonB
MNAPAELALGEAPSPREAGLWLGAAVTIVALHAAFAYAFHAITPFTPPIDAAEQALVIDLAPLPISMPESVATETLPDEQPIERLQPVEDRAEIIPEQPDTLAAAEATEPVEQLDPEPSIEPLPERVTPEPQVAEQASPEPDAAAPVETAEPIEPETVQPEAESVEQEIAEAIEPDVVVPLPEPRPAERKAEPQPRKEAEQAKPKQRAAARRAGPSERETVRPPQTTASQKSRASRAPVVNPSRWNNAVRAAIARRAGRVRGMQGTVRIQFVVTSAGAVASARVSSSSGNARLDGAALRMVRSARVPRPPEGISGSRHSFAIPLTFR